MEVYSRVDEGGALVVGSGREEFYREIPRADAHEVGLGGALISLVEPREHHELGFNRWYEDDHFYAGALHMPWLFAGRRYVATRELREMRAPDDSRIVDPITVGCFLHLFWIAPGHVDDLATWAQATNEHLRETGGRIYAERSHVFTHFHDYRGDYRPAGPGAKDYQTLDACFPGVVMEILEPVARTAREPFEAWIASDYLPWLHASAPATVAHSLWFSPRPPPAGKRNSGNRSEAARAVDDLVVLLHFLSVDPSTAWSEQPARNAAHIKAAELATLHLNAPFRAVTFGTDRYIDELR